MSGFVEVIQYFSQISAVVIMINSFLLFLCLMSIRPNNRKRESMYLGFLQGLTEFSIGAWLLVSRPIFLDLDFSFIATVIFTLVVFIALFIRLYFFIALRYIYSR